MPASTTFIHRLGCLLAAMLLALTALSSVPAAAQRFDDRDPAYAEFYQALDPHGSLTPAEPPLIAAENLSEQAGPPQGAACGFISFFE